MVTRGYNAGNPSVANPDVKLQGIQYAQNPDAAYGVHIKDTGCICNTSAAHTYGNILSVIEKYLIDQFPPDLFKFVTASTTFAPRQLKHLPHQLIKKECPMMVLVPRISFGQEDNRFLGNTLFNSRPTNTMSTWGDGSLIQLAHDRKHNIFVHGHYNRAVMFLDVILSFNTYSEQMNWMSYIDNMFALGVNKFIRAPLELYLPEEFCKLISELSHIPIINQNNSVYDFLTFMNGMWYPNLITYKLKGGSNRNEFFMYYISDIDTVISDVNYDQGIKDGQIRRHFNITFTVRCDFNTIGYFTLNCPSLKRKVYVNEPSDGVVPMFSDQINLDDFHLPLGWSVLTWPIFKLGPKENSISLESVLNNSLNAVIDYHLRIGIPMTKFINIQFRENGRIIENEAFYIDWHKKLLFVAHPDPHRTYRLIITISHEYINSLIKQLYDLE